MPEFGNQLNVICLESEAFYVLIEKVVDRLKDKQAEPPNKWISDEEAMQLLHVSSKSTMQRYRNEGFIRYTQPSRKVIMYDRQSIMEFLESKAKNTF